LEFLIYLKACLKIVIFSWYVRRSLRFVGIGWIDDHHYLNFLFKKQMDKKVNENSESTNFSN
jgi:hypothetical protein